MFYGYQTNSLKRPETGILWSLTRMTGDIPVTTQTAAHLPTTTGRVIAQADDHLELSIPGTDYRLTLATDAVLPPSLDQRITGVIHARARRVDVVRVGGRFVEPVFGRPRRLQGRIIGGDVAGDRIFVNCGGPVFVCELTDARQHAANFAVGQIVAFDIESGAKLEV